LPEQYINNIIDAIRSENFPNKESAKQELISKGKYNRGTARALDIFYGKLTLKNGKTVIRTKKGQIQVRDKRGLVLRNKNNQYAIKEFRKKIEGKSK
jgi:hypothetical protein